MVSFTVSVLATSVSYADKPPLNPCESLLSLYPHLSATAMKEKIQAVSTPFEFYRSFVPLFYKRLKESRDIQLIDQLGEYSGWCLGDAHIENFGIILNPSKKPIFQWNDLDDAGPCPLVADVLRYLVGVRLIKVEMPLEKILESYYEGLTSAKDRALPLVIKDKLSRSESRGFTPKKSDYDKDSRKLVRGENSIGVSDEAFARLESTVQRYLAPYGRMIDAIERKRSFGGSGGLKRYLVLLTNDLGELTTFEFKQMVAPGVFPLASEKIPSVQERIRKSVGLFYGYNLPSFMRVIELEGMEMLVRPRARAFIGVKVQNYNEEELREIIYTQSYLIGQNHRSSANQAKAYTKAISKSDLKSWELAIRAMVKTIEKDFLYYKSLHP